MEANESSCRLSHKTSNEEQLKMRGTRYLTTLLRSPKNTTRGRKISHRQDTVDFESTETQGRMVLLFYLRCKRMAVTHWSPYPFVGLSGPGMAVTEVPLPLHLKRWRWSWLAFFFFFKVYNLSWIIHTKKTFVVFYFFFCAWLLGTRRRGLWCCYYRMCVFWLWQIVRSLPLPICIGCRKSTFPGGFTVFFSRVPRTEFIVFILILW